MELAKNILVILLALLGVISIAHGAFLAWEPLGFIIGGLLVMSLALTIDQPFQKGGGNR